jgi:hypothetical protein
VNTCCGAIVSRDTGLFVKQIGLSSGLGATAPFLNAGDIIRQGSQMFSKRDFQNYVAYSGAS